MSLPPAIDFRQGLEIDNSTVATERLYMFHIVFSPSAVPVHMQGEKKQSLENNLDTKSEGEEFV